MDYPRAGVSFSTILVLCYNQLSVYFWFVCWIYLYFHFCYGVTLAWSFLTWAWIAGIYFTVWISYCEVWSGHLDQYLFCLWVNIMHHMSTVEFQPCGVERFISAGFTSQLFFLFWNQGSDTRRELNWSSIFAASSYWIHNLGNIWQSCYFSVRSLNVHILLPLSRTSWKVCCIHVQIKNVIGKKECALLLDIGSLL